MSEVIRGWALRYPSGSIDKVIVRDQHHNCTILPHDGEKVGPFEPWMVHLAQLEVNKYSQTSDDAGYESWLQWREITAAIEKVLRHES